MSARAARVIAYVANYEKRGEVLCEGLVTLDGRQVFRVEPHPSQLYVCNEIVDWANRLGKRDQVEWLYLK